MRDNCSQFAYHSILAFLNKPIREAIVYNFSSLISELTNSGAHVFIVLPFWFYIWPKWWIYWKIVVSRKSALYKINQSDGQKKAVVHYITATQLYNINDVWTHIVVEYLDGNGNRSYNDPYDYYRSIDYPNSLAIGDTYKRLYRHSEAIAVIT